MSDDHHVHGPSELAPMELRVRALETLLVRKGYVDPAALERLIETYEVHVGPHNGARVVARAWADSTFRDRLAHDATAAIASLGYGGRQGEHMVALFNTPQTHHMVVCTLCSCYPWPVLGLPPVWYKSAPYRSRAVIEPRAVLQDFGVTLPEATQVRVWDSTAEVRYLGVPMRPAGTEGWSEDQLAALVTRDSMIGTGLALDPAQVQNAMNGVHDMGGLQGFGPVLPEADEPMFHAAWERRALGLTLAMGASGQWNIDMSRAARESLPPATYLAASYYEIWIRGLERLMLAGGLVSPDELESGAAIEPPRALDRVLRGDEVDAALARGSPTARPASTAPVFALGQRVRALNMHPRGHTRLPRYVRGHVGTVTRVHGAHVYADRHARPGPTGGFDDRPEWLYTVEFAGEELWGDAAEPGLRVSVDAWEPYLEAAPR